jgi:hypothetical protein
VLRGHRLRAVPHFTVDDFRSTSQRRRMSANSQRHKSTDKSAAKAKTVKPPTKPQS